MNAPTGRDHSGYQRYSPTATKIRRIRTIVMKLNYTGRTWSQHLKRPAMGRLRGYCVNCRIQLAKLKVISFDMIIG